MNCLQKGAIWWSGWRGGHYAPEHNFFRGEVDITYEIIAEFSGSFYEASSNTTVPIAGTGWSDWSGPAFSSP